MPPRRATVGLRSGRFVADIVAGTPLTIVQSDTPAAYRVLNSGQTSFKVIISGTTEVIVAEDCSVDCHGTTLAIDSPDGTNVKVSGVFDRIRQNTDIRSGRFKSGAMAPADPITLVQNRGQQIYRVFNAGDAAINVHVGGIGALFPLQSNCSIDVAAGNAATPSISIGAAANLDGAIDAVESGDSIRSGRFKHKAGTSAAQKTMLDLRKMPVAQRYRITNGGKNDITVHLPSAAPVLKADQSLDVKLPTSPNPIIAVSNSENKLITGIYDYLGTE